MVAEGGGDGTWADLLPEARSRNPVCLVSHSADSQRQSEGDWTPGLVLGAKLTWAKKSECRSLLECLKLGVVAVLYL